jgi:hypothetical protein
MPETATNTRKPFNCLLSREEHALLIRLADAQGVSAGHVLRTALRNMANMTLKRIPICASGASCFVPQMHAQSAPNTMLPGMPGETHG